MCLWTSAFTRYAISPDPMLSDITPLAQWSQSPVIQHPGYMRTILNRADNMGEGARWMRDADSTMRQEDDAEWSTIPPVILARLRAIMLAFMRGVPDEQAHTLMEELRGFSEAIRIDPSNRPEAELLVWFLQGFSVQVGENSSWVFTLAEDDIPPSAEYLRRGTSGIWRLWYPGDPLDDA
jgi:hypothetical protein